MDRLVSSAWLEERLGSADLRILDCTVAFTTNPEGGIEVGSGHDGWEKSHLPGSRHVDLLGELSDPESPIPLMMPSPSHMSGVLSGLGVGDGTNVVVYDSDQSMWAARVWWMLRAIGFDSAAILDGGFRSWSAEGRPTTSGPEPAGQPATLTTGTRPALFATKAEVVAGLDRPQLCLIDALDPPAYRGERQDYARPGHIPGAHNVPGASVVDPETHRYLPLEDLKGRFAGVPTSEAERVVTYCGGGVAASSVAFALGLIGIDDVAVYDGSLIEWTADPSLPLVTGG